jgi:hypothetical protein
MKIPKHMKRYLEKIALIEKGERVLKTPSPFKKPAVKLPCKTGPMLTRN